MNLNFLYFSSPPKCDNLPLKMMSHFCAINSPATKFCNHFQKRLQFLSNGCDLFALPWEMMDFQTRPCSYPIFLSFHRSWSSHREMPVAVDPQKCLNAALLDILPIPMVCTVCGRFRCHDSDDIGLDWLYELYDYGPFNFFVNKQGAVCICNICFD